MEHVDDGNLYHRVGTGLLAHGGAGYIDQYLTGEGGIVDAHVELEELVLGGARYALASEVHAVAHILEVVDAGYLYHVGLIVHEIGVGLDGCSHFIEVIALLEFDVYHAAMDASAYGDGHGECILYSLDGLYGYRVAHAHAGAEVGVADAFGGKALHE